MSIVLVIIIFGWYRDRVLNVAVAYEEYGARSRVHKTHCFPRSQSISVLLYINGQRNSKLKNK